MGEEEKPKPKAPEEEKKKDEGEAKPAAAEEAAPPPPPPPPPPEEILLRVFMHCEGCARKVRRCLKGFDGVEEVKTDCKSHKVVVKGRKAAEDPLKVVERVQKKSGRKVELLSPMPPPKVEKKEEEEKKKEEDEKPKVEEKKEEPVVISVVLKVHMHCEACAQEIKKRILKMKGVQAAEAELKSSQVTVKGVFAAPELVEYVHKRTGKHAVLIKQEPAEKKPETAPEQETKTDAKADTNPAADSKDKPEAAAATAADGSAAAEEKKDDAAAADVDKEKDAGGEEAKVVEMKKYEYLYYQRYHPVEYAYPPQIFSDENPNACAVM